MRGLIALVMAAFFVASCSNHDLVVDHPSSDSMDDRVDREKKDASITQSKWKQALIVGAADMVGGYSGAKAGAFWGGLLGPKGAVFGGVVGCIIGGCGASLGASKMIVPPGSRRQLTLAPADFRDFPNSTDSIGWIHNEFVLQTFNTIYQGDTAPSDSLVYSALVDRVISRGYDNDDIQSIFPVEKYLSVVAQYDSVDSMDDLVALMKNVNQPLDDFWRGLLSELRATTNADDALRVLVRHRSSISSLPVSQDEKSALNHALAVGYYSIGLWSSNN